MSTLAIAILVGAGTWALLWALALWSLWARVDALEKRRPPSPDRPWLWEDPATELAYEWENGAWRARKLWPTSRP